MSNQILCPNNADNKTDCDQIPNSIWIASTPGSFTDGSCVCCSTDGTAYVDPSITTPGVNPCQLCPSNATCGKFNGHCKGDTGNSDISCLQDPSTLLWSNACLEDGNCQGLCSGNCGLGEWVAFQKCSAMNNMYGCNFTLAQWKSWLFYILILVILFLIGLWASNYYRKAMVIPSTSSLPPPPTSAPSGPPPPTSSPKKQIVVRY